MTPLQPANSSYPTQWQGNTVQGAPQTGVHSGYNPNAYNQVGGNQSAYAAPAPIYTNPMASPAYNPYSQPVKRGATIAAVVAGVIAAGAGVFALLGALLPFLTRGRSVSLVQANAGAGFSVILVGICAAVFLVIATIKASTNVTFSRILSVLGGVGSVFLVVFTLANLFGADANRIVDLGGTRGVGGMMIVGAGIAMIIACVLAIAVGKNPEKSSTGQA
ncbi:MAG: hypothetical protein IKZ87_03720 [Actinomycetaceae bacterium]|nr:hypothetical protein [Actinomycetaceae bacterium]